MTYKFNSVRGVLDSDPKGKSGRGTQFYLHITDNEGADQYYTWYLLDEIEGKFDPSAPSAPFVERAAEEQAILDKKEAEEKRKRMQDRINGIDTDKRLEIIITEVVKDNEKAVNEYRSGKEKALNSLVGQVIGKSKKEGGNCDAFVISTMLKKALT